MIPQWKAIVKHLFGSLSPETPAAKTVKFSAAFGRTEGQAIGFGFSGNFWAKSPVCLSFADGRKTLRISVWPASAGNNPKHTWHPNKPKLVQILAQSQLTDAIIIMLTNLVMFREGGGAWHFGTLAIS
jgi:hypothetical protein